MVSSREGSGAGNVEIDIMIYTLVMLIYILLYNGITCREYYL
jgi:hypothetical protein